MRALPPALIGPSRNLISRKGSPWIIATLAYLLLTIVVTYPVAAHLGTQIAGDNSDSSDAMETVWGIWWWQHALLDLHQTPLRISVLNHPAGQDFPLYPLMSQTFLLALPGAALVSPVFAYNFLFLISFVLCGLGGYALCTELSGDGRAGFVGGLIWAFFPAKMAHAVAGHLFLILLFTLPLATLALVRVLTTPTIRNGLFAALALALAGTIHPIYLAYFVAPVVMALALSSWWTEGRAFWRREKVLALATALGLAAALIAILLIPTFGEMRRGTLGQFGPRTDVVGLSPDALAYFIPSSDNPLIRWTPLARLAVRVQPYQYAHLIYVGWLPLLLAFLGARARPTESRLWVLLALGGGILALGPLLKIGGDFAQVLIAGEPYRVVMPYALVANLPLLQWSRTPGRLTVLVMLAVSVLAALGVSRLLKHPTFARHPVSVLGFVSLVIAVEYLARFPFPTFPAEAPAPLTTLRADPSHLAAIQAPISGYKDNQRALYWQTVHQHPLVGGRVYRDLPEVSLQYDFYNRLLLASERTPVVSLPSDELRWAVLAASGVGWVIYDAQADPTGVVRAQLEARLGPATSEAGGGMLFKLPTYEPRPDDSVWELGPNWQKAQAATADTERRFCQHGVVYLFEQSERTGRLAFTAAPAPDLRRVTVLLNGQPVGHFAVGDEAEYHTEAGRLVRGFNLIEFVDAGRVTDQAGNPEDLSPCEIGDALHSWGPAISNLRLISTTTELPVTPVHATFGGVVELLGFTAPEQATPGQKITVHLIWRAATTVDEDLTVFIHLIGPDGQMAVQKDEPPLGGAYPTSQWAAGEVIAYKVALTLPADLPPGTYRLQVGVYRQPEVERLSVSGVGAQDNAVTLNNVLIK